MMRNVVDWMERRSNTTASHAVQVLNNVPLVQPFLCFLGLPSKCWANTHFFLIMGGPSAGFLWQVLSLRNASIDWEFKELDIGKYTYHWSDQDSVFQQQSVVTIQSPIRFHITNPITFHQRHKVDWSSYRRADFDSNRSCKNRHLLWLQLAK